MVGSMNEQFIRISEQLGRIEERVDLPTKLGSKESSHKCSKEGKKVTEDHISGQAAVGKFDTVKVAGVIDISKNDKVVACSENMNDNKIPFFPEVIIFNILVCLPADILYNDMRLVCRNWYDIIRDPDFIQAHLFRSGLGLLVQGYDRPLSPFFLEWVKENDMVSRSKVKFSVPRSFTACCDGLVLVPDAINTEVYRVVNPITNQQVILAPLPWSPCRNYYSTMACAASTRDYKVLHYYGYEITGYPFAVILTVGIDNAWRLVNTEHIPSDVLTNFWCKPLAVVGFIYWWRCRGPCILALDVETELLYQVPFPNHCHERRYVCLKSESFLTLGVMEMENVWEFWALMDPKIRKWRYLFKIDLASQAHAHRSLLYCKEPEGLRPILVLKNRDVVVFRSYLSDGRYIGYNVNTGNIFRCWKARRIRGGGYIDDAHVNSLVVLKS